MADNDLSRIVNLIMENPKLIEEIKNLSAQNADGNDKKDEISESAAKEISEPIAKEITEHNGRENENHLRRRELLAALKPYVSSERAQAIDTMMSISDILGVIKK